MIRLHRPSPSMTVALIALFVALGGTGYAAIKLPKNSVGTPQIKKNAVTSAKVKNGSLTKSDFKAGQLPAGAQGPKGDKGDKGDPGANGTNGTNGADGGLVATLPSGKTERGAWGVGGTNHLQANDISEAPISFPIPLATTLRVR